MTWQNSINAPVNAQGEIAAKRFYGDPKLATAYLPVAYALLGALKNQMALGGIDFGHRIVDLPDGTKIRVIRNGEQNILEISTTSYRSVSVSGGVAIFMETGYLDVQPMFPLYTGSKPAAKLYYGNAQLVRYSSTPSVFDWLANEEQKRPYSPGMNSLAVSSTWLPEDENKPEDKRRENPLRSSDKRYLLAPGTYGQHPNNRTGKLKLLLQARLGRLDSPDLSIVNGLDSINNSVGLFTHHSGSYSLVVLIRSGLSLSATVYPILINTALKTALATPFYSGVSDRIKETYLLSTARVDNESVYSLTISGDVEGSPFAYGWKFNYSGDKAAVVTNEMVYEDDNPGGRILWHFQRLYQVRIGENTKDSLIDQITLSLIETGKCTPRIQGDNLWFPYQFLGVPMLRYYYWETSAYPGSGRYVASIECKDVPMYCWFDQDDNLKVVRFSMTTHEGQPYTGKNWQALKTCGAGTADSEDRGYIAYTLGEFTLETIDLDASALEISGILVSASMEAYAYSGFEGLKEVKCRYPVSYFDCSGSLVGTPIDDTCVYGLSRYGVTTAEVRIVYTQSNVTAFTGGLLIIPFGCAEAAYIGVGRSKGGASTVSTYITRGQPLSFSPYGPATVFANSGSGGYFQGFNTWNAYGDLDVRLVTQHNEDIAIEKGSYEYSARLTQTGVGANATFSITNSGTIDELDRGFGEWNYAFSPILFGPNAFPYFRPLYTFESDAGEATYHDSEDFSFTYGTTEPKFPYSQFFSLFVGWV